MSGVDEICKRNAHCEVTIGFFFGLEPYEREAIALPDDVVGRIKFLQRFVRSWETGEEVFDEKTEGWIRNGNDSFFQSIFKKEEVWKKHYGERVMFTLAKEPLKTVGQEYEFRCWYASFGCINPWHIDSCGSGLLFEVRGAMESLAPFVSALTENYIRWRDDDGHTLWAGHRF